jgi:serine protease Do
MISSLKRIVLLAAAISAVSAAYVRWGSPPLSHAHAVTAPAPAAAVPSRTGLPDFSVIVERWGPAVVNISTTGTARADLSLSPDDPMGEFLRRFGLPPPNGDQPVHGLGSGFIVGSDGVILTNAHVVDGSREILVRLSDQRELPAQVLGIDRPTDIAVLKIKASGLPTVQIGNPDRTRVGEWVLAIGSPFGFDHTATAGIVSAKSRSLPDGAYVPFLQTDVAVNPGNSGGPLFNLDGEVIGITSQIFSRSGGYQGLSFAIPIDIASQVKEQILSHGKVTRGRLGVSIQSVDQALADAFGLSRPAGALVSGVDPDSPAARAGVRAGDVIVKLDGQDLASAADLPPRVGRLKPGTGAKLEVWRQGKPVDLEITVGTADSAIADAGSGSPPKLGLAVRPLTAEEKRQSGETGGLLVEAATAPAAAAGVTPGDLVLAVNGIAINSIGQFRDLVAKSGKHVALLIRRGDDRLFVPVEIS